MMPNMEQEVLDWIDRQLSRIYQSHDGEVSSVEFNVLDGLPINEDFALTDGCVIRVISKTSDCIVLSCWMDKGVTLDRHKHPDFIEVFYIEDGHLLDKAYKISIKSGDVYLMEIGRVHEWSAIVDTTMKIICHKKNK